jgi:putative DNA primase/helicase
MMHTELAAAKEAISQHPDLHVVEREAARLATFDEIPTEDIESGLVDAAVSAGLEHEAARHVARCGIQGQSAFAEPPAISGHAARRPTIASMNVYDFLATDFPPRELMLAPWLPVQGLALIHAPRGIGKTHLALGVAWSVATGSGFLQWTAPKPRRVLILDGEMPAATLQERLRTISNASDVQPPSWDHLTIAASDFQERGLPDLASPEAQKFYTPLVEAHDLVMVDNLSTICRSLKENEADSWGPVQEWALGLRRLGKSAAFIHHGGKSGQQRGTSRKEDVMDTVIGMRRPPDYSSDQGARFEIHFEKSRGFYGEESKSFEAWLTDGLWKISDIKSGDDPATLKALRASGLSIRDIAERTGLGKSTVARKLGEGEE